MKTERLVATAATWALTLLTLVGCQVNTSQQMQDYNQRLSRVLAMDVPEQAVRRPELTSDRQWQADTTEIRLAVFEAWGFRRCQLTELMGERNSSLGKVLSASQQYLYEARLLTALDRCLQMLDEHPELMARSLEIQAIKASDHAAYLYNATLGGPEFRQFVSYSQREWSLARPASATSVVHIFQQWQDWQQQPPSPADAQLFEQQLQTLRQLRQGGGWLKSVVAANQGLRQAEAMLQRAVQQPLCQPGRYPAQAEIADNVLQRQFIVRLQPHLGDLNRYGQLYVPALLDLAHPWQTLSPEAWQYASAVAEVFAEFQQSNRDHSAAWQALLASCNRPPPGAST